MELNGMIAIWDFCLFLLGIWGVPLFICLHRLLTKCNEHVFAITCVIIIYLVISLIK